MKAAADRPEVDPLLDQLGQALSLFEKKLEEVAGETSASFHSPQAQILQDQTSQSCSHLPEGVTAAVCGFTLEACCRAACRAVLLAHER